MWASDSLFSATDAVLAAPPHVAFFDRFFHRRWRVMRQIVRDRERLAASSAGGSADHPIAVASASVVEVRVNALVCPQCGASYQLRDHRAPASGLRAVDVRCRLCSVGRTLWFRLVDDGPN